MLLSEQAYQKIDRELAKFPADQRQSAIMASLAIAQEEKGWLATDIIEDVANYIGVPPIAVQEVATFYNMFDVKPVGKNKISVCTNLPCALRDGERVGDTSSASWASTGRKPPPTASSRWWKATYGACGDSPCCWSTTSTCACA